jgi:hypothetical protein
MTSPAFAATMYEKFCEGKVMVPETVVPNVRLVAQAEEHTVARKHAVVSR